MAKKILILSILLLNCFTRSLFAQHGQCAYQISFKDKNGTPYSLSAPAAYLSDRSILRRANQGISIDSTDLPVNRTYIDSILRLSGGVFHEASRWQNLMVVLVMDTDTVGITNLFQSQSFVSHVELVGFYAGYLHLRKEGITAVSAATTKVEKTTSDNVYFGNTWPQTKLVNGNRLYDLGYTGDGKMISVLDAGFSGTNTCPYGFDSLRNSGRILDVYNFSYGSADVYDYDTHGTEVLSTMAGYVPDTFVGSAPLAMYNLYVTEIDPTEQPLELTNFLSGVERADSMGTDVITSSLGYNTFDANMASFDLTYDSIDGKTTIAARAVNAATKKGILCVITAGNEGSPGDTWHNILTPGDADSALTIGNVNEYGIADVSSGYGPNAAGQIKPDVCAQGDYAAVVNGSVYSYDEGTSFSTPQVAGWAACLLQGKPTATPYELRKVIDSCATAHSAPSAQYGYGVADFACAAAALNLGANKIQQPSNRITTAPNPFDNEINLNISLPVTQKIEIHITDMSGRSLQTFTFNYEPGSSGIYSINTQSLPCGIYVIHLISGSLTKTFKVVKR